MHEPTPNALSTPLRRLRCASVALVVGAASTAACAGREVPPRPPPPPAAPPDPPILASVARACVRLSACSHATEAHLRDPGACVDWWLTGLDPATNDPLRRCLLAARSCEDVSTCMRGGGDERVAEFCARRPGVVSGCDGDRLVSCADDDGHASSVVDCGALGASCREVKSSGLVVRGCWSSQECPPGAPDTRCDGSEAVLACRDGAVERVRCPTGSRCEERTDETGQTVARCERPGIRCRVRGARWCDEGRLVECDRGGEPLRADARISGGMRATDCAGFGLRCAGKGPRAGCFVPSNVECERELMPRCDGDTLVFCAAGRLERVACDRAGLGRCDPFAKGSIAGCAGAPGPGSASGGDSGGPTSRANAP